MYFIEFTVELLRNREKFINLFSHHFNFLRSTKNRATTSNRYQSVIYFINDFHLDHNGNYRIIIVIDEQ